MQDFGVISLSSLHVTGYAASCDNIAAIRTIRRLGSIHIESLLDSIRDCNGINFLKEENERKLELAYAQEGYVMPSILRMITDSVLHISDIDNIGIHDIGDIDKNFTINIGYNESNLNISLHKLFSRAFMSFLKDLFKHQSNGINPYIDIVVPSPLSIKGKDFIVTSLKNAENSFDIKINNIYSSAVAVASTFLLSNDSYNLLLRNNGYITIAVVEIGEEYTSTSIINIDVAGEGLHHKTNDNSDDDDVVLEEHWINENPIRKMPSVVISKETCAGICDFGLREGDACIMQSWFQDLLDLHYSVDAVDKKNKTINILNGTDLWFTLSPETQGQCLWAFLQFRKSFRHATNIEGKGQFQVLFNRLFSLVYQNISFMMHPVTDTKQGQKPTQTTSALTISVCHSTLTYAVYTRSYKLHYKLNGNDNKSNLEYVLGNSIRTALSRRKYGSSYRGFSDQIDAVILWQECNALNSNGNNEGYVLHGPGNDNWSMHKPAHLEDDIIFSIIKHEFNEVLKLSGKTSSKSSSPTSFSSETSASRRFSPATTSSLGTPTKNVWSDVASAMSSQSPASDSVRYDVRWKAFNPHTGHNTLQDSITPWLYCDYSSLLHGLISLKLQKYTSATTDTTSSPAQPLRIYQCLAENIGVYIASGADASNTFSDVTMRDIAWIYGTGETYMSTQNPSIHSLKGDASFSFSYNMDQSIDLIHGDVVYWTFRPSALTKENQFYLVYFQGTSINITESCNIEIIYSTPLPFLTTTTVKPAKFSLQIGYSNGLVALTLNHEGIKQTRNTNRKNASWTLFQLVTIISVAVLAWLLQRYVDAHVIDWMR